MIVAKRSTRGIIPAYAGQMSFLQILVKFLWDHPRIRGTNTTKLFLQKKITGSSPHTRDKFDAQYYEAKDVRIIPAYAGQMECSFLAFLMA